MKITIIDNEGGKTEKAYDHLASLRQQTADLQKQLKTREDQLGKLRGIFLEMAQIANFMSNEQAEV